MTNTRIGVDCNLKTSRFIQTPAHLSAFGGHPHCLQWLLQSDAEADCQVITEIYPALSTISLLLLVFPCSALYFLLSCTVVHSYCVQIFTIVS